MCVTTTCLSCRLSAVRVVLDFGPQPPSNRFEHADAQGTDSHPLVVGQCGACGLVQLIAPMAPTMVKSRFEWLTYNEPEGHLDDLVARLSGLPGIDPGARIVGLTYKDDTTLDRFNRMGYTNTYRYDPGADLASQDPCAGIESIQASLDTSTASQLVAKHGAADLLLVRHVLEHAHDPAAFLLNLCKTLKPGAYLLLEMPDCTKFITACDYPFIWEEHITYFSSDTLATFLLGANFSLQEIFAYPYPLEDSLIAIVKNGPPTSTYRSVTQTLDSLLGDWEVFSKRYLEVCTRVQAQLGAWRQGGKRVAILGASHLAAKFVNIYSLGELIECVIDDDPHKHGLLMPGSRLPIRGSAALGEIDVCLLSLSPESERKFLAKNRSFLDHGGESLSIFALNPNSVYNSNTL